MKSRIYLFIACLFAATGLCAQSNQSVIAIWPSGVPESNGITVPEGSRNGIISNISVPSMTVYPAAGKNTGAAVLVCPGGSYICQASIHEGSQIATWFSENGITAFVLKYRLPNGHAFIPSKDALQAIRIIRTRASEWGINPTKVGISGFSAGGHLASTVGTHFTQDARPDFMILFYPVISMDSNLTHMGSKTNLLGQSINDADSIAYYSNELRVTSQTPPTLLMLSDDDKVVLPGNSVGFYTALKQHQVPASIHIFPEGGHGWGYNKTFRYHEMWKAICLDWLKQQKVID